MGAGIGLFATDTRTFFGHRTFHQENDERHHEHHDGEQPKTIEIGQCRCLLMTQVLQRLPRQLLRGGWISGLLEETRLRLLEKGLYGSSELRISEVAGKSGRASRTA